MALNYIFIGGCIIIFIYKLIVHSYTEAWYWASTASITSSVTWGMR